MHRGREEIIDRLTMEVASCSPDTSYHAASVLAGLNLQRHHAQFCDCVIRQRQSPAHLYPAHRCVLAASSPVLASLLSSAGALLELQAPCLSDCILTILLDYIYTGNLPTPADQQLYRRLLSAARYLQMDKLQEALSAWQASEANFDGAYVYASAVNKSRSDFSTYSDAATVRSKVRSQPFSHSIGDCMEHKKADASDSISIRSSYYHAYHHSTNTENFDDQNVKCLAETDPCIIEKGICSSNGLNVLNCCGDGSVNTANTCCSVAKSTVSSVNTYSCIRVNALARQDWLPCLPSTAEVQEEIGRSTEERPVQLRSPGTPEPAEVKVTREGLPGELERTIPYSPCVTEEEGEGRRTKTKKRKFLPDDRGQEEVLESAVENYENEEQSHIRRLCSRTPVKFQSTALLPSSMCPPQVCPSTPQQGSDNGSPLQSSVSLCSSSSPPGCEAVPVIHHCESATQLKLAEQLSSPTLHPVPQTTGLASSSCIIRNPFQQTEGPGEMANKRNKDRVNTCAGVAAKDIHDHEGQNQDYSDDDENDPKTPGIQNWNHSKDSDHGVMRNTSCKANADQHVNLHQRYESSTADRLAIQTEGKDCELSKMRDSDDHLDHFGLLQCDDDSEHQELQSDKSYGDFPHDKEYRDDRIYQYKTDMGFGDSPSKYKRGKFPDAADVSMATAEDELAGHCSQRLQSGRDENPHPVAVSDTEVEHCFDDQFSQEEEEEDRRDGYLSLHTAEINDGSACVTDYDDVSTAVKCSRPVRAERKGTDGAFSPPGVERLGSIDETDTGVRQTCLHRRKTITKDSTDTGLPASSMNKLVFCDVSTQPVRQAESREPNPFVASKDIVDAETAEPNSSLTKYAGGKPANVIGEQSHCRHLHYWWIPQKLSSTTQTNLHTNSECKHHHSSNPAHLPADHPEWESERDEMRPYGNVDGSPLRRCHTSGTGTKLLLLDISSEPARLLVSPRADGGDGGDEDSWTEATVGAAAGVAVRFESVGRYKAETKTIAGDEKAEKRSSGAFPKEQGIDAKFGRGVDVLDVTRVKLQVGEKNPSSVSSSANDEGAAMTTCPPVCPRPSAEPEHGPGSPSFTAPVSLPPTLPVTTQAAVSTCVSHLTSHPYQCSQCDRSFSQRGSLNRHIRSHLGVKPYSCPHCPMTFSRQYRVTEHMRVHQRCVLGDDLEKALAPPHLRQT